MATKDDKSKKKQSVLSADSQQKIRDNDNRLKPDKASRAGEEPTEKILEAFVGLSTKIDGLTEKLEYHNKELGRYNETLTQILKQAATPAKPGKGAEESEEKETEDSFITFRAIYHNLDQRSTITRPEINLKIEQDSLYPGSQDKGREKHIKQSAN